MENDAAGPAPELPVPGANPDAMDQQESQETMPPKPPSPPLPTAFQGPSAIPFEPQPEEAPAAEEKPEIPPQADQSFAATQFQTQPSGSPRHLSESSGGALLASSPSNPLPDQSQPSRRHHLLRHTLPPEQSGEHCLHHFGVTTIKDAVRAIHTMSQRELQIQFERVYSVRSSSNNNNWLRKKLMDAVVLKEYACSPEMDELMQEIASQQGSGSGRKRGVPKEWTVEAPQGIGSSSGGGNGQQRKPATVRPSPVDSQIDYYAVELQPPSGVGNGERRRRRAAAGVAAATAALIRDPALEAIEREDLRRSATVGEYGHGRMGPGAWGTRQVDSRDRGGGSYEDKVARQHLVPPHRSTTASAHHWQQQQQQQQTQQQQRAPGEYNAALQSLTQLLSIAVQQGKLNLPGAAAATVAGGGGRSGGIGWGGHPQQQAHQAQQQQYHQAYGSGPPQQAVRHHPRPLRTVVSPVGGSNSGGGGGGAFGSFGGQRPGAGAMREQQQYNAHAQAHLTPQPQFGGAAAAAAASHSMLSQLLSAVVQDQQARAAAATAAAAIPQQQHPQREQIAAVPQQQHPQHMQMQRQQQQLATAPDVHAPQDVKPAAFQQKVGFQSTQHTPAPSLEPPLQPSSGPSQQLNSAPSSTVDAPIIAPAARRLPPPSGREVIPGSSVPIDALLMQLLQQHQRVEKPSEDQH